MMVDIEIVDSGDVIHVNSGYISFKVNKSSHDIVITAQDFNAICEQCSTPTDPYRVDIELTKFGKLNGIYSVQSVSRPELVENILYLRGSSSRFHESPIPIQMFDINRVGNSLCIILLCTLVNMCYKLPEDSEDGINIPHVLSLLSLSTNGYVVSKKKLIKDSLKVIV